MGPDEFTEEQKQRRVTICQDLSERQDDILGRVITGDETWVNQYDPETKRQSAQREDCQFPTTKKNSVGPNQESKICSSLFLMSQGFFVTNLYLLVKQSTEFTIWKYWKGCVEKLDGDDPNFLPTTHGSCITTMHLLTRHCL